MNKTIVKIFICALVLLVGIGAVSAMEQNSTEEFLSLDQSDEIAIIDNNTEDFVQICNDDEAIVDSDNCSEVLSAKNMDNELDLVDDNGGEVLSAKNTEVESGSANGNGSQVLASFYPPSDIPLGEPVITHSSNLKLEKTMKIDTMVTKELVFAKVKMSKKDFKRFVLKTPSKKNKKLWKKYKRFNKKIDKKLKKSMKKKIKSIRKKWKIDWYYGIRPIFVVKGKYCTLYFACMCYKYV